jgi:hypothetical protein
MEKSTLTLTREFSTNCLDEKDLQRLVDTINQLSNKYGGLVEIQVTSGDGQTTVNTTDVQYLSSVEMLRHIRAVRIKYDKFDAPVNASVSIGSPFSWGNTGVGLEVSGSARTEVNGIFRELDRELDSHRAYIEWFGSDTALPNFAIAFVASILLSGVANYSAYTLLRYLLTTFLGSFRPAQIAGPLGAVFVIGILPAFLLLRACFPPVKFSGALSDPGRTLRSSLRWILLFVTLPIVVNLVSSFLPKLLQASSSK